MATTYLQLPPQMGGVRFGPFPPGVIYLGSDPSRCQIVLNANQGVFAVHCMVAEAGASYTVAPVQAGLKVFLVKKGEQKAWPVTSPVQANPGDWVVLGSEAGPRFEIQQEGGKVPTAGRSVASASGGIAAGGGSGFGDRMASEFQRQAMAKLMTKNPAFREAYMLWSRFRFGGWNSPYFIVSVIMGILGFLGAGSLGCSGGFYALYRYFQ